MPNAGNELDALADKMQFLQMKLFRQCHERSLWHLYFKKKKVSKPMNSHDLFMLGDIFYIIPYLCFLSIGGQNLL